METRVNAKLRNSADLQKAGGFQTLPLGRRPIQITQVMRRRLSGFFSLFLVLTFSSSGTRACDDMAHKSTTQAATPPASGNHEHHAPASSDSHHPDDHRSPLDHCASATSCAGLVLATDVLVESVRIVHSDRVVQVAALAPASQSPDLEPPPPKA